MERFTKSDTERFGKCWKQVGECKMWQRPLDKDGYGTFYFKQKGRKAHRVSYYFAFGDIPTDMVIDHICKNRNCIEITHLKVVTKTENTLQNSISAGAINKSKLTCKNGHPFDKIYGTIKKQRYCSICENEKSKRLRKKWLINANKIKC